MFEKFVVLFGLSLVTFVIILTGVPIHVTLLLVCMVLFCVLSLIVGVMHG